MNRNSRSAIVFQVRRLVSPGLTGARFVRPVRIFPIRPSSVIRRLKYGPTPTTTRCDLRRPAIIRGTFLETVDKSEHPAHVPRSDGTRGHKGNKLRAFIIIIYYCLNARKYACARAFRDYNWAEVEEIDDNSAGKPIYMDKSPG